MEKENAKTKKELTGNLIKKTNPWEVDEGILVIQDHMLQ